MILKKSAQPLYFHKIVMHLLYSMMVLNGCPARSIRRHIFKQIFSNMIGSRQFSISRPYADEDCNFNITIVILMTIFNNIGIKIVN